MKEAHSSLQGWDFHFREAGLAKSTEIDSMTEECKLFRAPNIIFDQNLFIAEHKQANFKLTYNAKEAMKFMNYEIRQKYYNPPEAKG
jgi:hypothetical protein